MCPTSLNMVWDNCKVSNSLFGRWHTIIHYNFLPHLIGKTKWCALHNDVKTHSFTHRHTQRFELMSSSGQLYCMTMSVYFCIHYHHVRVCVCVCMCIRVHTYVMVQGENTELWYPPFFPPFFFPEPGQNNTKAPSQQSWGLLHKTFHSKQLPVGLMVLFTEEKNWLYFRKKTPAKIRLFLQ